jgi:8-amino-7-oxononanoate synthase
VAQEKGLLSIPLSSNWEGRPFLTHIVTLWTRQKYIYWMYMHLLFKSFFVLPVKYPVVPLGESRLRITFHAENTIAQVEALVNSVFEWVEEIMAIEEHKAAQKVTKAANEVYAWMRQEGLKGFGME